MRLSVFGASGRTGRPLVEQALAAGHEVAAAVRTPSKLDITSPSLTVAQGDVMDAEAVRQAVDGADAVALALGQTKGAPPNLLETAARNVVAAMEHHGVRRVVTVMGAGVPDMLDPGGFGPTLMRGLMKLVARRLLNDAIAHVDVLRGSGLDWTVLRPPRLTEGPRTGDYSLGYYALGPGDSVARADVAAALLHLAGSDAYVREAPMIKSA